MRMLYGCKSLYLKLICKVKEALKFEWKLKTLLRLFMIYFGIESKSKRSFEVLGLRPLKWQFFCYNFFCIVPIKREHFLVFFFKYNTLCQKL